MKYSNFSRKTDLIFRKECAIIQLQRVAILRKSGCRKPHVFSYKLLVIERKFNNQIVLQKCVSPDFGLAHYFFEER